MPKELIKNRGNPFFDVSMAQCISEKRPLLRSPISPEKQSSVWTFPRASSRLLGSGRMLGSCIIFTLMVGTAESRAQERWSVTEGARSDVTGTWKIQRGARDPQWRFGGYYLNGHADMQYPTGRPLKYELRGTVALKWGTDRGILQRYEFSRWRPDDGVGCRYVGLLEPDGIIRGDAYCGPTGQIKVPWIAKTR